MQSFLNHTPDPLDVALIIHRLSNPGRLGDQALGDDLDAEFWLGDDDHPELPDEFGEGDEPELLDDDWHCLATHEGYATETGGKIDALSYTLRLVTPTPGCFSPEPAPNPNIDAIWSGLARAFEAKLGKPTRRSKNTLTFAWATGEVEMDRSIDHWQPWNVVRMVVTSTGSAPWVNGDSSAVSEGSVPSVDAFERPEPEALKAELNDLAADSFGCRVEVVEVEVFEDAPPYRISVGFEFDPETSEDEFDSFELIVSDPTFDIATAAIESMGECIDAFR